jgi:HlyD family secretion protein
MTNSHLLSLLSAKESIETGKKSVLDAYRSIVEKSASLNELKAGPDALDLRSQELSLKQKQNSLQNAKEKLADYIVIAPISGTIAQMDVKKNDSVSAGAVIAVIIGKEQMAEITLNEVDVAKVKVGQKATLTFDALPDLTITGKVAEVDSLGTVSQGVVSYAAKIVFDFNDDRIKPSMSVSADIIVDSKTNVLLVPNSAVKSQNSGSYVEVPNGENSQQLSSLTAAVALFELPKTILIEIGLSNDEFTEIVSGISEGQLVVTGSVSGTKASASSSSQSGQQSSNSIRIPSIGGGSEFGR